MLAPLWTEVAGGPAVCVCAAAACCRLATAAVSGMQEPAACPTHAARSVYSRHK